MHGPSAVERLFSTQPLAHSLRCFAWGGKWLQRSWTQPNAPPCSARLSRRVEQSTARIHPQLLQLSPAICCSGEKAAAFRAEGRRGTAAARPHRALGSGHWGAPGFHRLRLLPPTPPVTAAPAHLLTRSIEAKAAPRAPRTVPRRRGRGRWAAATAPAPGRRRRRHRHGPQLPRRFAKERPAPRRLAALLSRESRRPRLTPLSAHLSRELGQGDAMAAAPGAEGLFELELLVEAVRVAAPAPALRPAVALRFLDFPTLLLRPAALASPLRPGQAFPFGRGKRCLFRWRRDSLCVALRSRPLRALLLLLPAGLTPGPPSLLGSCGVSLAPAADELLQRPAAPASYGRRGPFPLRDAAGCPVGELVLGYRLTSLEDGEESPPPNPASPRAALLPATSPEPVGEKGEEEGEELEGNIFCPPMLYYSHEASEPHLPPVAAGTAQWKRVKTWVQGEKEKGQSPPHPSAGPSLLHPASSQQFHNTLGQLPLLSALLAELSVLAQRTTAASVYPHLAWPHQAPGSSDMASRPLSPSHSCTLKHAEAAVEPGGNNGAASPRFKQGQQEATSAGSSRSARGPKKTVSPGETGSERNCKTKENRPPRKKLFYGLTNTLRLRLKKTNPDKLIIHERREQYRKKQMEKLKEKSPLSKKKLLRRAEEHVASHRHCSKGDASKQSNQFDKTVETSLQNSGVSEYIAMTGDVSSDLRKRAIASLLKNYDIASKEHPWEVTTATLPEETVLKSAQKEKYAKTQLSASFPSDANAKGSNEEGTYFIHPKATEHSDASVVNDHKPRPSRSVESNSEFIYSDDFIASPENTLYSEDFTSVDRVSEALDNSPEPLWLESTKRGWSDTESESSRSRISKTSQRDESTSDLLPVPSASSPVQSLKRNRDLKNSKGTSGQSVDSLILAGMGASLLDEEREAQHTDKEENRGDQDVKQVATLRSKQVSSDTDLNVGKGQNSAGQSQSETQVSSYLPSNRSDLELGVLENSMSDKEDYFLEKLGVPNQCKDISELVINKLPGYTM